MVRQPTQVLLEGVGWGQFVKSIAALGKDCQWQMVKIQFLLS
jgi:hypothetical protein